MHLAADAGSVTGREVGGLFDVETQAGSVRLEILDLKPGEHRFRAAMGSVRLELASGLDVCVETRTALGSIRNAYTVRLLNKRGFDRVIAIDIDGPVNATVHVVGADSVTPDRPMIVLGRDQTTELRLLVTAPSENNPEKSVPVRFRITDIGLGEVASATDNFVSP